MCRSRLVSNGGTRTPKPSDLSVGTGELSVTVSVNLLRGGQGLSAQDKHFSRCRRGGLTGIVDGAWAGVAARQRRITMQPFISQALLATRIAEMHREAADRAARPRPEAARRRAQQAPDAGAARHTAGPAFR